MEAIKDILEKISSYHFFNYLLPGILFVIITKEITQYNFLQENIFNGFFLYYFMGLVLSRIGSIFIEPFLRKIKFLKFADYKNFVTASAKDIKIEVLSEVNNTYRTLLSMFIILGIEKTYCHYQNQLGFSKRTTIIILILSGIILFLYSYRKQTNFITKRIESNS